MDITSLQDGVVNALENAIFRGQLKMGQRILEDDLAHELNVSRATMREALRRLEQIGLVQIKPRHGTFVTHLTLVEIERTCRLRAVLEGLAARYASERLSEPEWKELEGKIEEMRQAADAGSLENFLDLDHKFHERVWELAGDKQLIHILRFLSNPYFAFIASVSTYVFSDLRRVWRAHKLYVDVLRERDPELVQKRVQEIHEGLAVGILADIRRAQAESPEQIFRIEDGD
jgi:DNA-binding GntR family transcriptional regulator